MPEALAVPPELSDPEPAAVVGGTSIDDAVAHICRGVVGKTCQVDPAISGEIQRGRSVSLLEDEQPSGTRGTERFDLDGNYRQKEDRRER